MNKNERASLGDAGRRVAIEMLTTKGWRVVDLEGTDKYFPFADLTIAYKQSIKLVQVKATNSGSSKNYHAYFNKFTPLLDAFRDKKEAFLLYVVSRNNQWACAFDYSTVETWHDIGIASNNNMPPEDIEPYFRLPYSKCLNNGQPSIIPDQLFDALLKNCVEDLPF